MCLVHAGVAHVWSDTSVRRLALRLLPAHLTPCSCINPVVGSIARDMTKLNCTTNTAAGSRVWCSSACACRALWNQLQGLTRIRVWPPGAEPELGADAQEGGKPRMAQMGRGARDGAVVVAGHTLGGPGI